MANARVVEDSNRPVLFRATHFEPGRRHDDEPLVIYDYNTNLPIGPEPSPKAATASASVPSEPASSADSVIVVEICD